MTFIVPIILLIVIGILLWHWRRRLKEKAVLLQTTQLRQEEDRKQALRQRARGIKAARDARSTQAAQDLPAYDPVASAQRMRLAIQEQKAAWPTDAPLPQVGLSMGVFVSYGATDPDIRRYTRNYLLSRFHGSADMSAFEDHPAYAHRLGTSPKSILNEFMNAGLLREFNAVEALDHNLKATELKEILRAHGQPVSGKKAGLIQQVLELDDDRVRQATQSPFFTVTEKGKKKLAKFYEQERLRHAAAQNNIRQALLDGDIGEALKVSSAYDHLLMWGAARIQNDEIGRSALAGILSSGLGNAEEKAAEAMMALLPESPPGVRPLAENV